LTGEERQFRNFLFDLNLMPEEMAESGRAFYKRALKNSLFCHPELVSGSLNPMILLDAEISLP
jgi:hypothetical protein